MLSREDEAKSLQHGEKFKAQVQALNNDDCAIGVLVRDGKTLFALSSEIELECGMVTGSKLIPARLQSLERIQKILEDSLQQVAAVIAGMQEARQSQAVNPELN